MSARHNPSTTYQKEDTMTHTIAPEARATKVRKRGQAAFNDRGDRLVSRVTGPRELPYGTTVIDAVGGTWGRGAHAWYPIDGATGQRVRGGTLCQTLDLAYPLVVVDLARGPEPEQNRAGRRFQDLQDRRDNRAQRRFRARRVRAFLAASSPEDRIKYAAALAPRRHRGGAR